jgi:hypothetical protein
MGAGTGIGVVALTTLAGGCAAFGLATFLIWWLPVSNFEGGAGYFAVIVTLLGAGGGFLVGAITAASVRSGFATAQLYALGAVTALTLAAGILVVVLKDDGPKIDGSPLRLQVELRFPLEWKPDNLARFETGAGCLMQAHAANESPETPPDVLWRQKHAALNFLEIDNILGKFSWQTAPSTDQQGVASCIVDLGKTTSTRYMRVYVGHRTDVTLWIPLPRRPGPRFEQWSEWNTAGFAPQTGKPAVVDYAFRFRVARKPADQLLPDDFREAQKKAAAALPPDAPLLQWLPFYENQSGGALESYLVETAASDAVKNRAAEFPPLLRSRDRDVVRRAAFAARLLDPIPASLIEPLAESGRHTLELIRDAKSTSLPGDPDLVAEQQAEQFFSAWDEAMDKAGAAGTAQRRTVLEEIDREVHGDAGEGGIHDIAVQVAKALAKLGPAAQ